MPMQLEDFPRWLRALFAVFLILFFFNALYALAFFTAIWTVRVDPGVAALIGTIVGLGLLGWLAWLGFSNLIRSQERRAAIEMEARQHQHRLYTDREEKRIDREKHFLMAALKAEIVGLAHKAQSTMEYSITMQALLQEMIAANAPNSTKSLTWPTFNAPVYQSNLSKLGLLGTSLGADVVMVMTKTGIAIPTATFDQPLSNEMAAKLHQGMLEGMGDWKADLLHVAMRIRALEGDAPDPGTLMEAQIKRQQEKEQEQKEKAASSGSRRTIPRKRP